MNDTRKTCHKHLQHNSYCEGCTKAEQLDTIRREVETGLIDDAECTRRLDQIGATEEELARQGPISGYRYKFELRDGRVLEGIYMGLNYAGEHLLDMRPKAGTATIPDAQIRTTEPVNLPSAHRTEGS